MSAPMVYRRHSNGLFLAATIASYSHISVIGQAVLPVKSWFYSPHIPQTLTKAKKKSQLDGEPKRFRQRSCKWNRSAFRSVLLQDSQLFFGAFNWNSLSNSLRAYERLVKKQVSKFTLNSALHLPWQVLGGLPGDFR